MKIFLIGMMGSGKTFWMNRLARKLKLPRYDLDQLVEGVEDRSVQQIFSESGEAHFRKMESIVLKWFADKDDFIMATGGGTPCFFDNIEWMNNEGITIWLDEDPEILVQRLTTEKSNRPLIAGLSDTELRQFVEERKAQRHAFYSQARYRLEGPRINEKNLLEIINQTEHA